MVLIQSHSFLFSCPQPPADCSLAFIPHRLIRGFHLNEKPVVIVFVGPAEVVEGSVGAGVFRLIGISGPGRKPLVDLIIDPEVQVDVVVFTLE